MALWVVREGELLLCPSQNLLDLPASGVTRFPPQKAHRVRMVVSTGVGTRCEVPEGPCARPVTEREGLHPGPPWGFLELEASILATHNEAVT